MTDEKDDIPALFYAVQQRNNEIMVRAFIESGADVNKTDEDDKTALFYAVQESNNENVVRALIESGADVNKTCDDGKTALFYAVQESNNENVVRALIESGADVNKTCDDGKTALFYAVQESNNENVVRALIESGADVNKTDLNGQTALFYAVQEKNNENVIRALIESGADVNKTCDDGKTALFYAVQESNNENVIRSLIESGADVNKTDRSGQTALFYAFQKGNNKNSIQELIEYVADVNKTNSLGKTALFYAVQQSNNETVVQALTEACNDIEYVRDIYGRTALFYSFSGSSKTFTHLLQKGGKRCLELKDNCNVDIVTVVIDQCASSHWSSINSEIFEVFENHGVKCKRFLTAIINMMFIKVFRFSLSTLDQYDEPFDWHGKVPYRSRTSDTDCIQYEAFVTLAGWYKIYIGRQGFRRKRKQKQKMKEIKMVLNQKFYNISKALVLLVELGADPHSADSDGNTALHFATRLPLLGVTEKTVMDVCHQLENYGVQINARNHQNQTPLLFCLSEDCGSELQLTIKTLVKVCKFLLDHGSSLEETSRSGKSVFHLIIKLFQDGLDIEDETIRDDVLNEVIKLLQLLPLKKVIKTKIVNKPDANSNSPLHLWASLALASHKDYASHVTKDHTFEMFLQRVFNHLFECGAIPDAKNENNETPLHLCKTWGAVKILIEAGANPNNVDSSGSPPLLAAAKLNKTFLISQSCFYPDLNVSKDAVSFWRSAIDMGLDPWTDDKHGETLLSILIESEAFALAKALVDVACEKIHTEPERFAVRLLDAICKDKSTKTQFKTVLVQAILESRKRPTDATSSLRLCCKNIVENIGLIIPDIDPIYANCGFHEILMLLRLHGADANSCLEIAENCPPLKDLLKKPIDVTNIPAFIPWISFSKKYEDRLAKVARRQECDVVNQFWLHKDPIGSGSFGDVFAGINEEDGREVAIKRIVKSRLQRPEDKREITNLTALKDCEKVVRYLLFFEDEKFSYIVLELMEGNLDEYLDDSIFDRSNNTSLCKDVVKGLEYLHQEKFLHRDLKPGNILYKTHPKLCLKIADFGLSRRVSGSGTKLSPVYGSRCWIAPELLKCRKDHSKLSDMFSCGLVLHYILSVKKHPFSKNKKQMQHEIEGNITEGKMEGWDDSLSPEATHLVKHMLQSDKDDRSSAEKALDHPLFWSQEKKIDFLKAVGNQPLFEYPRAGKSTCLTAVETDLEKSFSTIVGYGKWNDPRYSYMPDIYAEMTTKNRKSYDTTSAVELVRFIRNAYSHVSEDKRPTFIRKLLLEDFVFLDYFPHLVMEVYKVVTTHKWDQKREEVKYAMNK